MALPSYTSPSVLILLGIPHIVGHTGYRGLHESHILRNLHKLQFDAIIAYSYTTQCPAYAKVTAVLSLYIPYALVSAFNKLKI